MDDERVLNNMQQSGKLAAKVVLVLPLSLKVLFKCHFLELFQLRELTVIRGGLDVLTWAYFLGGPASITFMPR